MSQTSTRSACQALIAELLPARYPTIDQTACLLCMPVRTLQRRLRQYGVSYRQLIENTRFEMACRLLGTQDAKVTEIAKILGYADPASFSRAFLSRAFQRWAGMPPRVYRRRSGPGNGVVD